MGNKLLSFFNYNGFLYEVFVNENNEILYTKAGKKQKNGMEENDNKIIKKLLDKIAEMKYVPFDKIEYNNKKLNMYINLFDGNFYFSQYYNNKEIACEYNEFKSLYDRYNNAIIYNYIDSNNSFGNWGDAPINDVPKDAPNNDKKTGLPSKNKYRIVKIMVSGVLIAALVITSTVMIFRFKGHDDKTNETSYTEMSEENNKSSEIPFTEMSEEDYQKAVEYIRESLKDEEPWVIEKAIEYFEKYNCISRNFTKSN